MSQRICLAGLLAAIVITTALPGARAADLDEPYDGLQPPLLPQTNVEFGSGWYIRGDIGVTRSANVVAGGESYDNGPISNAVTGKTSDPCFSNAPSPNCTYNNSYQYNRSVFSGPAIGAPLLSVSSSHQLGYNATLGGGYQFNHWFRADGTFDFLKPVQSSYLGTSLPCITGTAALPPQYTNLPANSENIISASCTPSQNASLTSFVALVNGYVDLGTWYHVTPYVGAGVGLSFGHASVSATYVQNNGVPYHVSYTDALSGSSFYQNWDRQGSSEYYNVAFALMGGVAIDVYDHTKLDIGYRYLHLGDVLGANLSTQEVRAGLRYMIDN